MRTELAYEDFHDEVTRRFFCIFRFYSNSSILQDSVDELHEIPISVAIIVLVGVGALLLRTIFRDNRLSLSSRVLICAFELLRPSGCPDRSTVLSVWMSSEKFL